MNPVKIAANCFVGNVKEFGITTRFQVSWFVVAGVTRMRNDVKKAQDTLICVVLSSHSLVPCHTIT